MPVVEISPAFHMDGRLVAAGYDNTISLYSAPTEYGVKTLYYSTDNPGEAIVLGLPGTWRAAVDPDMMSTVGLMATIGLSRPQDAVTSAHHRCLHLSLREIRPPYTEAHYTNWFSVLDPATPATIDAIRRLARVFDDRRPRPKTLAATGFVSFAGYSRNNQVWSDEDGIPFAVADDHDTGIGFGAQVRFDEATLRWRDKWGFSPNLCQPIWLRREIAKSILSIQSLSL